MKKLIKIGLVVSVSAAIVATIVTGCKSPALNTVVNLDSSVINLATNAMRGWSSYVNSKVNSSTNWWVTYPSLNSQILSVSNSYNSFYQSELVFSNLAIAVAAEPTNATLATQLATSVAVIGQNATNIYNLVNSLTK
jgi:hypothetical protein